MKRILYFLSSTMLLLFTTAAHSQQSGWPKIVTLDDNSQLKVYEPQPESFTGNLLKIKSAISYLENGKTDPVFGVLWADITTQSSDDQTLQWQNIAVKNIKLPADNATAALDDIISDIEEQGNNWHVTIARSVLDQQLKQSKDEAGLSQKLSTAPPTIIYRNKPSMLVFIDGDPQVQENQEWGVEQVVNTPFTILKSNQQFYLYGNKHWYRASAVKGPWNLISSVPSSLAKAEQAIKANDTAQVKESETTPAEIVVSNVPAELIQSNGEANFSPIQGTNLLYMTNSSNDVFMDVNAQRYYVLLSGRWYTAQTLSSAWSYTSADKLPADFAKIPDNSPKAGVLASVAGTEQADESVAEAEVPQTAKVDRKNATANVTYDGDPSFEDIDGTDLKYGVNSSGQVLQSGRTYYYVENGVWFQSQSATGPWVVATQRPSGIENIPPGYPVYNLKYVHIYDVYPDYVYMGYTPGYLGNYIFGPTIVYGTGYYYRPWRGRYYYPRPITWGFNMRYSPWIGWGFGFDAWPGWFFSVNYGYSYRRPVICGGWWGPTVYRPPFYRSYPSYYGRTIGYNSYRYTAVRNNNIYRYRRDVVTSDRLYRPSVFNRSSNPGRRPNSYGYSRPSNGFGNRGGNTFDRNNNGRIGSPSRPSNPNGYRQPNNNTNFGSDRNRRPDFGGNNSNDRLPNAGNNGNLRNRQPNIGNGNFGNRQPNAGNNGNFGNRQPSAGDNGNFGNRQPNAGNNGNANSGNPNVGAEPGNRRPNFGSGALGGRPDYGNINRGNNNNSTSAPRPLRSAERPQFSQPSQAPARQSPGFSNAGGSRPERAYTPSSGGEPRVRMQSPSAGRPEGGGSGNRQEGGGGREGRRRG